jgi:hypothetical protein
VCDTIDEASGVCSRFIECEEWCTHIEVDGPQPMNLKCIALAKANTCQGLEDECAF